jgi:hypothetical protein
MSVLQGWSRRNVKWLVYIFLYIICKNSSEAHNLISYCPRQIQEMLPKFIKSRKKKCVILTVFVNCFYMFTILARRKKLLLKTNFYLSVKRHGSSFLACSEHSLCSTWPLPAPSHLLSLTHALANAQMCTHALTCTNTQAPPLPQTHTRN